MANFTEKELIDRLKKHFPQPWIDLNFENPYQLTVATILAAQSTDKKVNQITPIFFKKFPTPQDVAKAPLEEIEEIIKSINYYKRKAKLIKECCKKVVEEFGGKIPDNMEDLLKLPGIGRKTASVILVNAFNKPAIVVDTHVRRVAVNRLKISNGKTPEKIEKDLSKFFSKDILDIYITKIF